MPMPWNFDSEVFESQIPPEKFADVKETEIETPKILN